MNKGDLIEAVAKVTNTKKEAAAAVDCVLASITKSLKKKKDVTLIQQFPVRKLRAYPIHDIGKIRTQKNLSGRHFLLDILIY